MLPANNSPVGLGPELSNVREPTLYLYMYWLHCCSSLLIQRIRNELFVAIYLLKRRPAYGSEKWEINQRLNRHNFLIAN